LHVQIVQKRRGWIALSPLTAQPEPVNLSQLKSEILKRWPMLGGMRFSKRQKKKHCRAARSAPLPGPDFKNII